MSIKTKHQEQKNDQEHVNNLVRTLQSHGVYHLPRRRHAAHRQHATCLMLCRVAELLIQRHGLQGAETRLKADPTLWQNLLQRQQTPQMLATFDVLADYMIDNAIYFFRERIEEAFRAATYAPSDGPRTQKGSNDTIYRKLAGQFTTEEAYGATVSVRGFDVQRGRVFTMLSRWERQGMVERIEKGVYKKTYR